jgi:hypothetical protein
MTLTVRSSSLTGATTAARALTHAEMDANWAHVIESSNQNFTPSGSGAVARTVAAKLQERVSVLDFIPVSLHAGIVAGTNSTGLQDYIQAALDAHDHVHFPAGTYLLSGTLVELELADNHHLSGDGMEVSIIKQGSNVTGSTGSIYANGGSSSTYIDGLHIHDLCLDGMVATRSFSEFQHLCSLNGVKDALIERVKFLGYRGDGLYVGSGITGGDERHNVNVTVRDCVFDGVNSDNRNGISVIDGDGIHILRNTFRNTTKSTMPGPIDVEPDSGNTFAVIRNITIEANRIESFSGGLAIGVYLAAVTTTEPMFGIKIKNNYIAGATKSIAQAILVETNETISSSTKPMGIEITGNEIHDSGDVSMFPFILKYVRDVRVAGNTFKLGTSAVVGEETDASVSIYDAVIENNHFYRNGNSNGCLSVYSVDNLRLEGNTFEAPNDGAGDEAISFTANGVTCASSNVRLLNNTFIKGTSQTKQVTVSNHTLSTSTNADYGNRNVGGSLSTDFTADYKFSGFYQTGTWTPVVAGSSTAGTQTYTVQQGAYTRVGRAITVTCTVTLSAVDGGIAGAVLITGLPVASANVSNQNYTVGLRASNVDLSTGYTWMTGLLIPNSSQILVRECGDDVADQTLPVAGLNATSQFSFTLTYFTADA